MPDVISLFAGCGGCSLGLEKGGYTIRLAADYNADACATYSLNLEHEAIWQVDLSQVSSQQIQDRFDSRRPIDLLVGGPPCQGFSSAGARDWNDPRNKLLRQFVEWVIVLKPTWFVMENVEGLLTAKDGFYLIEAVSRFLNAGYWVRAKKVYMEQYGLPQRRKRVFVVGNLEQKAFQFPIPTFSSQPFLPLWDIRSQMTLDDAIGDLPEPSEDGEVYYERSGMNMYQNALRRKDSLPVRHHISRNLNEQNQERMRLLLPGQTMKNLPDNLQHSSFKRRALRRVMDGTPTEKRGGAPSGLKRLVATQPSLTITSASPSEFAHPTQNRFLTLRECARIQSFPDWFEFVGSWSSIAMQIGNAIPPLFMQRLGEQIARTATWQPTYGERGRWLGIESTKSEAMSPALARMMSWLEKETYAFT